MEDMDFVEQIDFLIYTGAIEGYELLTLHNLLKSYEQGLIGAEEMQYEIDSFKSEFYLRMMQNNSHEH